MSIVPMRRRTSEFRIAWIVAAVIVVLVFGRSLCSLFIDYLWWQEMGQVGTWLRMWAYRYAPAAGGWLIVFIVLLIAHARGMKYAGTGLRRQSTVRAHQYAGAGDRRVGDFRSDRRRLDARALRGRNACRTGNFNLGGSGFRASARVLFFRTPVLRHAGDVRRGGRLRPAACCTI